MIKNFCDCCEKEIVNNCNIYKITIPVKGCIEARGGLCNNLRESILTGYYTSNLEVCRSCFEKIGEAISKEIE